MDEHAVRAEGHQRFEPEPHGILTRRAAHYRRHNGQAGDAPVEQRSVFGSDRDQHIRDSRVLDERSNCMAQDVSAPERQVLLWEWGAKSAALARSNHERIDQRHD
jgi:hypothetical protein